LLKKRAQRSSKAVFILFDDEKAFALCKNRLLCRTRKWSSNSHSDQK